MITIQELLKNLIESTDDFVKCLTTNPNMSKYIPDLNECIQQSLVKDAVLRAIAATIDKIHEDMTNAPVKMKTLTVGQAIQYLKLGDYTAEVIDADCVLTPIKEVDPKRLIRAIKAAKDGESYKFIITLQ